MPFLLFLTFMLPAPTKDTLTVYLSSTIIREVIFLLKIQSLDCFFKSWYVRADSWMNLQRPHANLLPRAVFPDIAIVTSKNKPKQTCGYSVIIQDIIFLLYIL